MSRRLFGPASSLVLSAGAAALPAIGAASCGVVSGLGDYDFACAIAADCPAVDSECVRTSCVNGQCGFDFLPAGTPVLTSLDNACEQPVCDGQGLTAATPRPLGTPCGVLGGCDGAGACRCDHAGAPCGSNSSGCLGCALKGSCKAGFDACVSDPDCLALATCLADCTDNTTGCRDPCVTQHPAGAPLYFNYERCVSCDECPVACGRTTACSE